MYYYGIINLWHNCINIYGIVASMFLTGYLKIISDPGINESKTLLTKISEGFLHYRS